MKSLINNLFFLTLFSFPHTWLLKNNIRHKLAKLIPGPLFATVYSLHASISLLLLIIFWSPMATTIYKLSGMASHLVITFYVLSWLLMTWSMFATDALYHLGLKQWWNYLNNRPTPYVLPTTGPYRFCRHPIFLSFFGMIWFTTHMTTGHLLLAIYWSVYLIIGTFNKEKALLKNKQYAEFCQKVPAYPFMKKGPFNQVIKEALCLKFSP